MQFRPFSNVECSHCGLNISGEYRIIAHEDPAYSDILGDYATEGQTWNVG